MYQFVKTSMFLSQKNIYIKHQFNINCNFVKLSSSGIPFLSEKSGIFAEANIMSQNDEGE